ncbi:Gustatory receptor [Aphis craccivora]|uniref:Gustatory receptor n=1 Tax=Aphis craccivora TaxID=307492 RepID=A0A6G0Y6D8_APHCR|nr:Gustatory receptor [Aphis craccivora]
MTFILVTNLIEMTSTFHTNLNPILILSKSFGLIDIKYTVEPSGLLDRNLNSTFYAVQEIIRMIVLLICTFLYFNSFDSDVHLLQMINIIRFWFVIIAARISAIQIIKFINGIIEFDSKIKPLLENLLISQHSWKNKYWNMIFILLFIYFLGVKLLFLYFKSGKIKNVVSLLHYVLFSLPFVMDYAVIITSCFFLQNMCIRFQTLNDIWKCIPIDLINVSGQWTHNEIVNVMENTRLLHSELCELLKMFSLGYGSLLLGFFSFSYINILLSIYFIINSYDITSSNYSKSVIELILSLMIHVQIVTFLMSIIIFVSLIDEKVIQWVIHPIIIILSVRLKIISYLRLYQISNLHLDIKRQIKMFMNQILACDSDKISAFGLFDINLNLVTSVSTHFSHIVLQIIQIIILVLLISGIVTLIQMKNHPIILKINNDTRYFFKKVLRFGPNFSI